MKTAVVSFESIAPYNQSRQHFIEKEDKETPADYENRTWKEKGHYDASGNAFIPPMAFKGAIARAAQMLDMSIPGRGKNKYTKHFVSGIMVTDCLPLGVKKENVKPQWLSCSPKGIKGGMGVLRAFPHFESWKGSIKVMVLDDTITKEVFEKVVGEAGNFVGIGQFRPEKGGYYGRFSVTSVEWE